ncbi:MAG: serine/threonine-protein kinase [Candidatus Competibacterales bacterium]|nr:serine/threonine-protein kinase [Candidatus Competibacterales bacterium]
MPAGEGGAPSVKIPGYTIRRELAHGGMATVYLAIQDSLERPIALKVMAPALANDPDYVERFLSEGRIVANLSHPYIVTVHDIGVAEFRPFMAMEYISGGSLLERLRFGLGLGEVFAIVSNVAQALAHAHEHGVVHRDVKPGNILFHANGIALLSDFGIAKPLRGDPVRAYRTGNLALGTPHYMSPEQALNSPVDARSDQYSLGVVLYECLTGRAPFQATDPFQLALRHFHEPVPRLTGDAALFQPLLDRLMAKDPDKRYPTDRALLAHLDELGSYYGSQFSAPARVIELLPVDGERPRAATVARLPSAVDTGLLERTLPSVPPRFAFRRLMLGLLLVLSVAGIVANLEPQLAWLPQAPGGPSALPDKAFTETLAEDEPSAEELAVDDPVARLLARAEKHLAADRLTVPADDNAYRSFRRVLEIQPGNPAARQGLEVIAERYAALARREHERGADQRALVFIERGLQVRPDHPELVRLRQEYQEQGAVDPCIEDHDSRACWCETFNLFCE